MVRRTLLVAVILSAGIALAPTQAGAQALAETNHFNWNICGGPCHNDGQAPVTAYYFYVAGSPVRPIGASAQEVCDGQMGTLNPAMAQMGYWQAWIRVNVNQDPLRNCQESFITVYWIGGCWGGVIENCVDGDQFNHQRAADLAAGTERAWLCAYAAFPRYNVCNTHLAPPDNDANLQQQEYKSIVDFLNWWFAPTYAAGDYNIDARGPNDWFLQNWYNDYDEADGCGDICGRITFRDRADGDTEKIDYIFVHEVGMCILANATIVENAQASDHFAYRGYLRSGC